MTKLRPYTSVNVKNLMQSLKDFFGLILKVTRKRNMEERIGRHQKRPCLLGIETYSKTSVIKTVWHWLIHRQTG